MIFKKIKEKQGITLIALIITIIVLLILAGISITTLTSENGAITNSLKARFYNELSEIDENIKTAELNSVARIFTKKSNRLVFTQDLKAEESDIPSTLLAELEGLGGSVNDLYYVPKNLAYDREKTYVYDTKIKVVFKINGFKIAKRTIHSMHGASVQVKESQVANAAVSTSYGYYEPDLNGFDKLNTYIVYYSEDGTDHYDGMTLAEYIEKGQPQTYEINKDGTNVKYYFHNYKGETQKSIWGNIITKANGQEAWWVWIPRYSYTVDGANKTSDVVFTDVNDNSLNSEKNAADYESHAGFNLKDGTKLKGIWMAKYEASVTENGTDTFEDGTQKYYKPKVVGYNIYTTYIQTYDSAGNSTGKQYVLSDILKTGYKADETGVLLEGEVDETKIPSGEIWCDYSNKIWGNIVTKANGQEAWWVWIPRYAYSVSMSDQASEIIFINKNNKLFNGGNITGLYTVHPAFTLEDGTELEGIWMAKYEASIGTSGDDKFRDGTLKYYKPNLKGFNINDTYIATYDSAGKSTGNQYWIKDILKAGYNADKSGVLISGEIDESKIAEGEYWYNYSNKIWANIVTKANGLEAWWVWIPRYAYTVSLNDQMLCL